MTGQLTFSYTISHNQLWPPQEMLFPPLFPGQEDKHGAYPASRWRMEEMWGVGKLMGNGANETWGVAIQE